MSIYVLVLTTSAFSECIGTFASRNQRTVFVSCRVGAVPKPDLRPFADLLSYLVDHIEALLVMVAAFSVHFPEAI